MAAVDLPINDSYLSHLHQARNARKEAAVAAALAAKRSSPNYTLFNSRDLERVDEMVMNSISSNTNTNGSTLGDGGENNSTSSASLHHDTSLDVKASDTAILSQYPTSLVRILVLLAPFIDLSTQFVRLATWTAGPGTASHSFLLLLSWWATCLYGYEILRYAPQAVLLSILLYTGLARAFQGINRGHPRLSPRAATSQSINKTIDNLAELSDFISTISAKLIEPMWALFTWRSFDETKSLTIFLISTWPIWLLCFGQRFWDALGLPRLGLEFRQFALRFFAYTLPAFYRYLSVAVAQLERSLPQIVHWAKLLQSNTIAIYSKTQFILSPFYHLIKSLIPASATPYSLKFTVLPPFPLFSLGLRHLLLVFGTLALTWCSPWCALIRHALWRSALVRQATRRAFAFFSGKTQRSITLQHSSSSSTISPHNLHQSLSSHIFEKTSFNGKSAFGSSTSISDLALDKDITRHEDVVYQFTVYENQRWWMGLDWTAALLPQERPSWADESNNPVSPPSSFSLPAAKTILKASPTSSDPTAYVKRLVRWQWIDSEWIVAGRESGGEILQKSRRESSPSSTTASGTLFSNSTATGLDATMPLETGTRRSSMSSTHTGNIVDFPSDLNWLDVDSEGWQYGDNSWEKMSKKGGLGRYTRRRRWIRRAVLVELVQRNYNPSQEELDTDLASSLKIKTKGGGGEEHGIALSPKQAAMELPSSPITPSSPRSSGDLKQRLAKAAQGSST